MKRSILVVVCSLFLILFLGSVSFANMKKSSVGGGGNKGFSFFASSDGFCTVTAIYDKASSQLGVAIGLASTGDLVCAGLSSQDSFQSCTAGLPSGSYVFIVVSLKGASPFRVVVNCTDQQNVSSAGIVTRGIEIKEIELDTNGKKLLEQFNNIAERTGKKK